MLHSFCFFGEELNYLPRFGAGFASVLIQHILESLVADTTLEFLLILVFINAVAFDFSQFHTMYLCRSMRLNTYRASGSSSLNLFRHST